MRFAVMVEGQEDVTWEQWRALAATAERLGFDALLRSDHYGSVDGETHARLARRVVDDLRARGDHEHRCGSGRWSPRRRSATPRCWPSPRVTADHISGGRIEVGIGTGWHEAEHRAYGFPFPPMKERMDRLAEQLEVIAGSWAPGPFSFAGEHYAVEDLDALPKPVQDPLPLLMGGAAAPRGAALAARFATEYNVVHQTPEDAGAAHERIAAACADAGRDPATMTFSLMHGFLIGADEDDLRERGERLVRADRHAGRGAAPRAGSPARPTQFAARLREYEAAGVERVMLQHHLVDDHAALELIASAVVPALA